MRRPLFFFSDRLLLSLPLSLSTTSQHHCSLSEPNRLMSKKNNLGTRKRVHAADLARERADAAARAAKAAKRAAREARSEEEAKREKSSSSSAFATPSLHATSGGRVLKKQKRNSLARAVKRVKKGVRINGIRVVDAETKAAARAAVRAAAALAMDVDDDDGSEKSKPKPKRNNQIKAKKKARKAPKAPKAAATTTKDKVMTDA